MLSNILVTSPQGQRASVGEVVPGHTTATASVSQLLSNPSCVAYIKPLGCDGVTSTSDFDLARFSTPLSDEANFKTSTVSEGE